jgi:hypothetical protein
MVHVSTTVATVGASTAMEITNASMSLSAISVKSPELCTTFSCAVKVVTMAAAGILVTVSCMTAAAAVSATAMVVVKLMPLVSRRSAIAPKVPASPSRRASKKSLRETSATPTPASFAMVLR